MADISGASLSIARPIVNNNGVNQQREAESQETNQQLRATTAPQPDRAINQQPSDIPPEESISARLDISVSANENDTQENTTVTREQVVNAVEQQLQQSSINANAARPADEGATDVQQSRTESTNNQTSNQTSEQLTANNPQAAQPQEASAGITETPDALDSQTIAATPTQNQPVENTDRSQASNTNQPENDEVDATQTTNETQSARNPETGLGLESGSIIDTIA
ncbi:hypothetical protein [Alkalimarinus coralli]|uniref:hypothetical protein n=1 Tax=Alkalimarinus coralli TaxID=2935863 RepID=UPI00202AF2CE|nr:hypothetical protein [Alkalimarinus coralli]